MRDVLVYNKLSRKVTGCKHIKLKLSVLYFDQNRGRQSCEDVTGD